MSAATPADIRFLHAKAQYAFDMADRVKRDADNVIDPELRRRLYDLANKYIDEAVGLQSSAIFIEMHLTLTRGARGDH